MGLNVTVIGSGSWATALVKLLLNNAPSISWYVRKEDDVAHIREYGHNPRYLSSVSFDVQRLTFPPDISEALSGADIVVLAVPSAFVHKTLLEAGKGALSGKIVYSAIKGIVPEFNLIVGEYLNQQHGVPYDRIGVITGPCHAEEVAMEKLSYLTIASQDQGHAKTLADLLRCRYINATLSDDIYGTEYSAVLKNVVAVAGGICHSLGYGDNFLAVLVSNAIQEIKRFVDTVHPIDRDIKASAYLGDLLVTAYSQFSRNRMFGAMIGKGYSVKQAQLEMNMIAEGYYAVKCVYEINRAHNVVMPITDAVYNIIYQGRSPRFEIEKLSKMLS